MQIIWINISPVIFACFFEIKKKKKECERLNDFFCLKTFSSKMSYSRRNENLYLCKVVKQFGPATGSPTNRDRWAGFRNWGRGVRTKPDPSFDILVSRDGLFQLEKKKTKAKLFQTQ